MKECYIVYAEHRDKYFGSKLGAHKVEMRRVIWLFYHILTVNCWYDAALERYRDILMFPLKNNCEIYYKRTYETSCRLSLCASGYTKTKREKRVSRGI